jgi:hypothetical protein
MKPDSEIDRDPRLDATDIAVAVKRGRRFELNWTAEQGHDGCQCFQQPKGLYRARPHAFELSSADDNRRVGFWPYQKGVRCLNRRTCRLSFAS